MALDLRYSFTADDLVALLARKWFPERTDRESGVILDWLASQGEQYTRFAFTVRVGQGEPPADDLSESARRQLADNTRKRIDILAWRGTQPVIIELKERVTPAALGQILTYRQLFLEDNADSPEPVLEIIGRYSDTETIRVMNSHGITVRLYPPRAAEV